MRHSKNPKLFIPKRIKIPEPASLEFLKNVFLQVRHARTISSKQRIWLEALVAELQTFIDYCNYQEGQFRALTQTLKDRKAVKAAMAGMHAAMDQRAQVMKQQRERRPYQVKRESAYYKPPGTTAESCRAFAEKLTKGFKAKTKEGTVKPGQEEMKRSLWNILQAEAIKAFGNWARAKSKLADSLLPPMPRILTESKEEYRKRNNLEYEPSKPLKARKWEPKYDAERAQAQEEREKERQAVYTRIAKQENLMELCKALQGLLDRKEEGSAAHPGDH